MPRYNYLCETCKVDDYLKSPVDGLSIFVDPDAKDFHTEPFVWEEIHDMVQQPAIKCPICGLAAEKTFYGVRVNFMIPGNFALNTLECKTLANIDRLENNDPYAHMRESGEKEEKITKFRKTLKTRSNWKKDKYQVSQQEKQKKQRKRKLDLGTKKRTTLQ